MLTCFVYLCGVVSEETTRTDIYRRNCVSTIFDELLRQTSLPARRYNAAKLSSPDFDLDRCRRYRRCHRRLLGRRRCHRRRDPRRICFRCRRRVCHHCGRPHRPRHHRCFLATVFYKCQVDRYRTVLKFILRKFVMCFKMCLLMQCYLRC